MIQERDEIILDEEYTIWAEDQVGNVKRLSVKCLGEMRSHFITNECKQFYIYNAHNFVYLMYKFF